MLIELKLQLNPDRPLKGRLAFRPAGFQFACMQFEVAHMDGSFL